MSCKTGYFIGGLFIGTVIGGALGVLMAPESGESTRRRIKEGAQESFGDMYDQAVEYGETLKEQLQDASDSLTDRVNQYKTQIENKIQEIQDEVNQDIDELNEELAALD
ncbi:MAG: YtxH domain-containing protein, partial [Eubacterium aggregans]